MPKQRPAQRLYLFVLASVLVGGAIGVWKPNLGIQLKPLGDAFISLVKMLIGPVIFCTVVLGISGAGDMRKVGRVGVKALVYFEVVSTLALFLGLLVMNFARPGVGFNVDPSSLDASLVSGFAKTAGEQDFVKFLLRIIPKTFTDAFGGSGDLLQVLLVALLFGYALSRLGKAGETVRHLIEEVSHIFFAMMNVVMKLAPFGACGAMAFTMGKYGWKALKPLASLMVFFYLTCVVFILCVLGPLARYAGFSILRFIAYIRDELLTVLGTSSSESALVDLMRKLERLGCSKSVTGLVVPAGFSFNLDGTNIYLTMASLFLAQALNIELSLKEQLTLLGVAMLTSKGASGVTGAGFITLAATLEVVPSIPVWSMALLVGIDRFMSEARALTNFIGNGVATLVIAHHEKELDHVRLEAELGKIPPTGG